MRGQAPVDNLRQGLYLTHSAVQHEKRGSPVPSHLARLAVAIVLVASPLALSGAAVASGDAASAAAAVTPDFGPNVTIFDPSMSTGRDPGRRRRDRGQQIDNEMGTERYALLFKPGTLRHRGRAAQLPGRLLHRGRRTRQVPDRRHHQRHVDVYNQCITATTASRSNNFWRSLSNLTDQRHGHGPAAADRRVLGRVPGRADAPGERQRPHSR